MEMPAMDGTRRFDSGAATGLLRDFPPAHGSRFSSVLAWCARALLRDRWLTLLKLVSHVLFALFLGGLYFETGGDGAYVLYNGNLIFFVLLFNVVMSTIPAIFSMCGERSLAAREHLNCSLLTYYCARSVIDLLLQTVLSVVFVLTVYLMSGQPREPERVLMFLCSGVLTALVAQCVGQLVGLAVGDHAELAMYATALVTAPVVLLSGFFISLAEMPASLSWLSYLSYLRYGFEGAVVSVYGFGRPRLVCHRTYCAFRDPNAYLQHLSMEYAGFWLNFGVLVAFFVVLRIMSCFVAAFRARKSR